MGEAACCLDEVHGPNQQTCRSQRRLRLRRSLAVATRTSAVNGADSIKPYRIERQTGWLKPTRLRKKKTTASTGNTIAAWTGVLSDSQRRTSFGGSLEVDTPKRMCRRQLA